ncbi:MAG: hypothetical protein M0006_05370 [Magnetospirillum sp.]|nr:hypothetical protein [Magnetospirillum sp.]
MTNAPRNPPKKTPTGRRFQPGNPGKPKGARRKVTAAALALIEAKSPAIVEAMIEAALGGDTAAGRALLDRIAAPVKGRPVAFDLPRLDTASDVVAALGALVQSVAAGDLTPDEAATVAALLEAKRKAIETVEIEARIAVLEGQKETDE